MKRCGRLYKELRVFSFWKKTTAANGVQFSDWPVPLQQLLSQPFSTTLPLALSEIADIQLKQQQLSLQLPFAAKWLQSELEQRLLALGLNLQLQVSWQNDITPAFKAVRQVILVASGKGGVGKSTTAVNLAIALSQQGARVGLLDADIYGPSVPMMLGEAHSKATSPDEKHLNPLHKYGITMQSIGFLIDPENATVWRGPMASQALMQLVNETLWPELDYLVVDMPPGTGDIQLTLSQKLPVAGAVIVTTPQDVALADAKKAIQMFRQVNIPLLGLVENMSFYQCPQCGHADDIFGTAGGLELAQRYQVSVLGQLPLQAAIRTAGDAGKPIALQDDNQTAEIYRKMAQQLIFTLYWQSRLSPQQAVEIIMTDD
jgi:ATP-binding protein involved in chromosome partitioning